MPLPFFINAHHLFVVIPIMFQLLFVYCSVSCLSSPSVVIFPCHFCRDLLFRSAVQEAGSKMLLMFWNFFSCMHSWYRGFQAQPIRMWGHTKYHLCWYGMVWPYGLCKILPWIPWILTTLGDRNLNCSLATYWPILAAPFSTLVASSQDPVETWPALLWNRLHSFSLLFDCFGIRTLLHNPNLTPPGLQTACRGAFSKSLLALVS